MSAQDAAVPSAVPSVPGMSAQDAAAIAAAAANPSLLDAALSRPVVVAQMTGHFFGADYTRDVPCAYLGRPLQCSFVAGGAADADVLW
jgi:hypothetical protein